MRIESEGIVVAVRPHGEHGAIVRALTPRDGVQPGFVRGGRSRRLRPILVPGNLVQAEWRARTDSQLAQARVELIHSRAPSLAEPLPAAGIDWATALTASTLPEGQPYPALYMALDGLLSAIEAASAAQIWAAALVRYELLLLAELGFGLDLAECAVTGSRSDLGFVSPRSGRAVSRDGAGAYADRLLALPRFVGDGGGASWPAIEQGLALSRHFLARDLLIERQSEILAARDRLVERLRRVTR